MGWRGERVLLSLATHGSVSAFLVLVGLSTSAVATYLAGGTHTAMPHLFYVPVVLAANRFGHRGALLVALSAGLLAGPAMPLDVATGTVQQPLGWLVRLAFFVLVGQVVALLCHRSLGALSAAVADRSTRSELDRALRHGELRVLYQPLVELSSGTVTGFEALLRWQHPRRGMLPPSEFIAAAERTGVIVPIGTWVLRQAAHQLRDWLAHPGVAGLKMAVNISARQLADEDLPDQIAGILEGVALPPSALQLEVTETALIDDLAVAARGLRRLHGMGVAVAIDDFGTGQSSLSYLHRLQADIIKIDRSFVAALEQEQQARAVAQGVIRLAESLGATTVGEGIETPAQAEILAALGCQAGQGYLYGRPMDAHSALRLIIAAVPVT